MAAEAKLNYTDTASAAVNVSFLNTSGFYLTSAPTLAGWIPKVAGVGLGLVADTVRETINLDITGADVDGVATTEQSLGDMVQMAASYWADPDREIPVWLHSQLEGETGERRALVQRITYEWLTEHYGPTMAASSQPNMRVLIERLGAWEQPTESTYKETAAISTTGGSYDYTAAAAADVTGTLPARLNRLIMWANTANMSVFWGGIRAAKKHSLTSYDPVFTFATDFTPGVDASDVVDATAKDGSRMEVTFATATWAARTSDGGGNIGDGTTTSESGDHLVLLRAKVDAGTTAEMKLSFSTISTSEGVTYTSVQEITETTWTIFPLDGLFNNSSFPTITLWARRTGGAGSLHVDCLVLIPVDSLFVFAEGKNVIGTAQARKLEILTREDGVERAWSARIAAPHTEEVGDVQIIGAGVPVGDGVMIVCAARADRASTIGDTLTLKMNHFPRWTSLRGSE